MMNYGFGEMLLNIINYIYTKIFWNKARLIRLPIRVRNKKNIKYDYGFTIGYSGRINVGKNASLSIGSNCVMGDYVQIECHKEVVIGNNVLFASKVFIGDVNHGSYTGEKQSDPLQPPNERKISCEKIIIEDNVWIGNAVCILPGVTIGKGAIIGANSVVTRDVPPDCIAVGNPIRIIKRYDYKNKTWEGEI